MQFDRLCTYAPLFICLKFAEFLESQKSSFSIFLVLKELKKVKKNKSHLKAANLVSQSVLK